MRGGLPGGFSVGTRQQPKTHTFNWREICSGSGKEMVIYNADINETMSEQKENAQSDRYAPERGKSGPGGINGEAQANKAWVASYLSTRGAPQRDRSGRAECHLVRHSTPQNLDRMARRGISRNKDVSTHTAELIVTNLDQISDGRCNRLGEFHTCDRSALVCPIHGSNCLGPRSVPRPLEPHAVQCLATQGITRSNQTGSPEHAT